MNCRPIGPTAKMVDGSQLVTFAVDLTAADVQLLERFGEPVAEIVGCALLHRLQRLRALEEPSGVLRD